MMAPLKSALMMSYSLPDKKFFLIFHPLLIPLFYYFYFYFFVNTFTNSLHSHLLSLFVPVHFSLDCKLYEGNNYTFYLCLYLPEWLPECFKPTKHKNVA